MTYVKQDQFLNALWRWEKLFVFTRKERLAPSAMLLEDLASIYVVMYSTVIIKYNKETKELTLNTWGRQTTTTKKNMNTGLDKMFGKHKARVYQEKWQLYFATYENLGETEVRGFREWKINIIYPII